MNDSLLKGKCQGYKWLFVEGLGLNEAALFLSSDNHNPLGVVTSEHIIHLTMIYIHEQGLSDSLKNARNISSKKIAFE